MLLLLLFRLLAFLASSSRLSSANVTQTQSQLMVSTNMKVKKTRFLSASPPQTDGAYAGLCAARWTDGCWKREEEEDEAEWEEEAEERKPVSSL